MVTQVDTSSDNFVARVIWICYVVVSEGEGTFPSDRSVYGSESREGGISVKFAR